MEKWIKCKDCGHEFSNKLSKCPECGKAHLTVKGLISAVSIFAIITVSVIGLVLGFSEKDTNIATTSQTQSQNEETSEKNDNKKEENNSSDNSSSKSEWTNAVSSVISSEASKESNTSSQNQSSSKADASSQSVSTNDMVITEDKNYETGFTTDNDVCYVTIPKYFLDYTYSIEKQKDANLTLDEFAYILTPIKDIMGISKVIKNPNGAVTYLFSNEKYATAIQNKAEALKRSASVSEILGYINNVEYSQHFDEYNIKFNVQDLTDEQQASVMNKGISLLEYQFYRKNSENSVTMNFTYSNGRTETIHVEEIIQQALDEIA